MLNCKQSGTDVTQSCLACVQVLFRIIPKEEEDVLRAKYAGSQAERISGGKDKNAPDKGIV